LRMRKMKARARKGSVKLIHAFLSFHHFFLYEYVNCACYLSGARVARLDERASNGVLSESCQIKKACLPTDFKIML
jgi:hypothetical protein